MVAAGDTIAQCVFFTEPICTCTPLLIQLYWLKTNYCACTVYVSKRRIQQMAAAVKRSHTTS